MSTHEHRYVPGKVAYTGKRKINEAEITWKLKDGCFSMSAGIWQSNKKDLETCGQVVDTVAAYFPDDPKVQEMLAVWNEWHLNDMTAGCEHQREAKWNARPIDPSRPFNAYVTLKAGEHGMLKDSTSWNMLSWVTRDKHPEGLLSHPCPVCGYKYGSAWLKRELPAEVVDKIKSWSK